MEKGFIGIAQVHPPDHIKEVIDRQVAEGHAAGQSEFLVEAARRYAEELELEDDIAAEAQAGIADADAGHYV